MVPGSRLVRRSAFAKLLRHNVLQNIGVSNDPFILVFGKKQLECKRSPPLSSVCSSSNIVPQIIDLVGAGPRLFCVLRTTETFPRLIIRHHELDYLLAFGGDCLDKLGFSNRESTRHIILRQRKRRWSVGSARLMTDIITAYFVTESLLRPDHHIRPAIFSSSNSSNLVFAFDHADVNWSAF